MHKAVDKEPANLGWLRITIQNIRGLVDNGGEDSDYLIGCYLNNIIEVFDHQTYNNVLSINDNFGLTKYRITKNRRIANDRLRL